MNNNLKLKGSMRRIFAWPLYLVLILIGIDIAVFAINKEAGAIVFLGIIIYLCVAIILFLHYRPRVSTEMIDFANEYGKFENRIIDEFDLPYAIMTTKGKILWSNKSFQELSDVENAKNIWINAIFSDIKSDKLPVVGKVDTTEIHTTKNNRSYRVVMQIVSLLDVIQNTELFEFTDDTEYLMTVFVYDETDLQSYIQKCEDNKLVLGILHLDNYDEALESVEYVRRSLLLALIDRKLSKYASDFDSTIRKIEKDKFVLISTKKSLEAMKIQKFSILETVKSVNIGNKIPVTLSMGIGVSAPTGRQNYEYAKSAIEMALGRGGDQVVIKDGKAISYYGGKSMQVEKNTRVKARVKAQALKELMLTRDRVIVMGHKITDVDALGAAIGIYRAGQNVEKPVHIVVNDPTTSIKPLMASFISNEKYDPLMFIDSVKARELIDANTLLIVVDTNRPSYTECPELLTKTKSIVVLDHHRRGNEVIENAVLSYVEPYASSTCEMVAEVLQYFDDKMKITNEEADCMYAGILIDTNNFTTRAGVRTFEAAAFLRRNGSDVVRVRKMLRDNIDSYKARAEAVRTAEIYKESFAIAKCPSEGLESPTVVGAQAANELLDIAGVKASFVMTLYQGEVFISARAIDEVNVQLIMEQIGGGGHLNVAGAQVKAPIEEVRVMLKQVIDKFIEEGAEKK